MAVVEERSGDRSISEALSENGYDGYSRRVFHLYRKVYNIEKFAEGSSYYSGRLALILLLGPLGNSSCLTVSFLLQNLLSTCYTSGRVLEIRY